MEIQELKRCSLGELVITAERMGIMDPNTHSRQELMIQILNMCARNHEPIIGEGTLEIVDGGFGFLRGSESSYLPSSSDIYVSPSQVKRFGLRTGDTISGIVRQPKDSERYLALLKIETVNGQAAESSQPRFNFEELVAIYPDRKLNLEFNPDEFLHMFKEFPIIL